MCGQGCLPCSGVFDWLFGPGVVGEGAGVVGVGVVGALDGAGVLVVPAAGEPLDEAAVAIPAAAPTVAIAPTMMTAPRVLEMCIRALLGLLG
jgi:hypothetical protein